MPSGKHRVSWSGKSRRVVMKKACWRGFARGMLVALSLAVPACGGRVVVDLPGAGAGATAAGGSTAGAGGAGGAGATSGVGGAGGASTPCDLEIGAACDCYSFPACPDEPVKGMPCCGIAKTCFGADTCAVTWTGSVCEDWCEVSCALAEDPEQCVAIGCVLGANGCTTP